MHSPPPHARALHAPRQRFTLDYREQVLLRDGQHVQLFPLGPAHAGCLARGFAALSPRSRFLRIGSTTRELSPSQLRYLTAIDGQRHFAIAARVESLAGTRQAGVGRIVQVPDDARTVEAAITVTDALQRRGLGSILGRRLVEAARERGYARLRAEVLSENRGMIQLLRKLAGPVVFEGHGSAFVATISLR